MTATMKVTIQLLGTWPPVTVKQGDTVTVEHATNQPDPSQYFVTHCNGQELAVEILVAEEEIGIHE